MPRKSELVLLNTSVVILAQQHNPSLLHPSFLLSQKIVPQEWETADDPISTPAVSIVKYTNGISFTVQMNRLEVRDNTPPDKIETSKIPELAISYIKTLPHVHYTAIGINLTAFIECSNPEKEIINRFLKPGEWNKSPLELKALGLRFVYPMPNGNLRLSCDSGTIKNPPDHQEKQGILLDANYHTDLSETEALDTAQKVILTFPEKHRHFSQTIATLIILK